MAFDIAFDLFQRETCNMRYTTKKTSHIKFLENDGKFSTRLSPPRGTENTPRKRNIKIVAHTENGNPLCIYIFCGVDHTQILCAMG